MKVILTRTSLARVLIIFWCNVANGQLIDSLIERLNSNKVDIGTILEAEQSKNPVALRALERVFASTQDSLIRLRIAVHLVKQRNPDDRYYRFLAEPAQEAVYDGAPLVEDIDRYGIPIPKSRSNRFVQWCQSHNLDVDEQVKRELLVYPSSVTALAGAMDPRAAPLFRQGIQSSNRGVALGSAYGLASLGAAEDVSAVIDMFSRQSPTLYPLAAAVLAAFQGTDARREVQRRVKPGSALENAYREALAVRDRAADTAAKQ